MAIGSLAGPSAAFPVTVLRVRPDGPNVVSGEVVVIGTRAALANSSVTVVLCRCGMSRDKPFCDGMHTRTGFNDPGMLPAGIPQDALVPGSVTITPALNGPFECLGPLMVLGADGRSATSCKMRLCRCGHSRTKPFCDGSHETVGFRS